MIAVNPLTNVFKKVYFSSDTILTGMQFDCNMKNNSKKSLHFRIFCDIINKLL